MEDVATPSPSTKMQTGHAHSMLMKLVAESDSKSVAFTEEVWTKYLHTFKYIIKETSGGIVSVLLS